MMSACFSVIQRTICHHLEARAPQLYQISSAHREAQCAWVTVGDVHADGAWIGRRANAR